VHRALNPAMDFKDIGRKRRSRTARKLLINMLIVIFQRRSQRGYLAMIISQA
jgi:hypothetical protein